MVQVIHNFQQSIRLPAANIEAALPQRETLDAQVHQAAASLVAQEPGLECATADEQGARVVHLHTPQYEIVITSRCGQDRVFQQGEKRSFVSYTITAASNLKSLDKATAVADQLSFVLRIVGAILSAFLLFWGLETVLDAYGHIEIPIFLVVVVLAAGAWLGERLGHLLGNWLQNRSLDKATQRGVLPQLEAVWFTLEHNLKALLKVYEST
ncbi:MAG TPA: hypothetical protein VN836_10475 [Verrucomicrobiae bacterium]|nr:hypothetical protein [Verrucomicrobiae bacterium]